MVRKVEQAIERDGWIISMATHCSAWEFSAYGVGVIDNPRSMIDFLQQDQMKFRINFNVQFVGDAKTLEKEYLLKRIDFKVEDLATQN